jgi:hypothetical protein
MLQLLDIFNEQIFNISQALYHLPSSQWSFENICNNNTKYNELTNVILYMPSDYNTKEN